MFPKTAKRNMYILKPSVVLRLNWKQRNILEETQGRYFFKGYKPKTHICHDLRNTGTEVHHGANPPDCIANLLAVRLKGKSMIISYQ